MLPGAATRGSFLDSSELAGTLSEPHVTVHRVVTGLLPEGIVGRVSHGTADLPSSQRCFPLLVSPSPSLSFLLSPRVTDRS